MDPIVTSHPWWVATSDGTMLETVMDVVCCPIFSFFGGSLFCGVPGSEVVVLCHETYLDLDSEISAIDDVTHMDVLVRATI
mmetsp:Transcript_9853/g.11400  ORF Transcript_9853/g.11400 Transcript_9853/m.11400 type:complete len:81 (-) Transcript_9853:1147-1389(-)